MRHNEPVSHIMSTDVKSVHTAQKLSDVYALLSENRIHHVPVVNGDALIGMVSSTDMMKLSLDAYGTPDTANAAFLDSQFPIEDVMSNAMVTVKPDDTIRAAAELLSKGTFHSLPVVEDGGKLVGIVTTTDLIKYLLAQY